MTGWDKETRAGETRYLQVNEDNDELERLYRARYRTFRDILAGVVGSHDIAREVVQEAFARALRDRRKFRREGSLEAWVWRIAFNVALRTRRDLRRSWDLDQAAAGVELRAERPSEFPRAPSRRHSHKHEPNSVSGSIPRR